MSNTALATTNGSGSPAAILPQRVAAHSVDDIMRMAENVHKSGLFPGVTSPQAAATLMLLCQADGLHPMDAIRRYHIIEGRPSMRSDAILTEFQKRGGAVEWHRYDAEEAAATFSHPRLCPKGLTFSFTFKEAFDAGITSGRDGIKKNWKTARPDMLRARVITKAIRMIDPGCVVGVYSAEEVADFDDAPAPPQPPPSNNTGYGRTGAYAAPADVSDYRAWVKEFADGVCAKWLDHWQDPQTGAVPPFVKDFWHQKQLANHLAKWARDGGLIQAGEDDRIDASDRAYQLGAVAWLRDREAVEQEAADYGRSLWRSKLKAAKEAEEAERRTLYTEADEPAADEADPEFADDPEGDELEPGSRG